MFAQLNLPMYVNIDRVGLQSRNELSIHTILSPFFEEVGL